MLRTTLLACLIAVTGCARSAIDSLTDDGGASGGAATAGNANDGDAGGGDTSGLKDGGGLDSGATTGGGTTAGDTNGGKDSGASGSDGGGDRGGTTGVCSELAATCEAAESLGSLDGSDSSSTLTRMGSGSGWFALDVSDGNVDSTSTSRIGLSVSLSAPGDATYSVTLVGDTGPGQGGRCIAADVSDTDPLKKTAIWGSFGPSTAGMRTLAVHVEKLSGTCDAQWTLTIEGNPCPKFIITGGEASMGSCD